MFTDLRFPRALAFALIPLLSASAQTWERVVPSVSGAGSAIGAGTGSTVYAGLRAGDVFRSDDNGRTWTPVNAGLVDSFGGKLGVKGFVQGAGGRVVRGGDNASWNNRVGSPIFYSDNQGGQWTESPLPFGSPASNPAGIGISDMVAHEGALYFSDILSAGVWKSTDNGQTWTAVGMSLPVVSPFGPPTRTYNAIASSGNALLTVEALRGVFRSTDGGSTWAQSISGIPGVVNSPLVGGRSWSGLDVTGAADGTAFVVADNRVYRSADAGASWTEVGTDLFNVARKVEFAGGKVFVATIGGGVLAFYESSDLGTTWTQLPAPASGGNSLEALSQSFYAHNGALYFAGTDGIYRLDLAAAARTNLPPKVTLSRTGQLFANVGGALRLAASVQGTGPFAYEWRLNKGAIAGQSAAALNWQLTDTQQSGELSLVVTGPGGSVTNIAGPLAVAPVGPGAPDYSFIPQVAGGFLAPAIQAVGVDTDGSVFFGGANLFSISGDTYRGVRHAFADGTIDQQFVTGLVGGNGTGPTVPVRTLLPMGDGSVLVGASGTGNNDRVWRRMMPDGSIDANWPWPDSMAGGPWKVVRLPDGKFLAGSGSVAGLHRLNSDGTIDESFALLSSIGTFQRNYVRDFVLLPDGSIIIAGNFNTINNVQRRSIARLLPSGGLDQSWAPADVGSSREITAILLLADGKLFISGNFTIVGGQARNYLARLNADGSLDSSFPNLALNQVVNSMALQPDGKVWIGGAFTGASGRSYVARLNLDGSIDTSIPDIGLNAAATLVQLAEDGKLWVGSSSSRLGALPGGQLVRIFTDLPARTLAFGGISQMPDAGSSIILNGSASGPFLSAQWRFNGEPIPGGNSLALPLNSLTGANSGRYELVLVSAGGSHTSAPVNIRVRGPVVLDRAPEPAVGLVSNSVSFAASAFGRQPLSYQWSFNGAAILGATNRSLTLSNLTLARSGDYSLLVKGADGSETNSEPAFLTVIPVPGTRDTNFAIHLFNISQFSPASVADFLLLPNGRFLVSGAFLTASNGTAKRFARLNGDGSVDQTFVPDMTPYSDVNAYAVQSSGKIVVALRLNAGGGPYEVRRFNTDGSLDTTFQNTPVTFPDDLIVADDDSIYLAHNRVSRILPNGGIDPAFESKATFAGSVESISRDSFGRIYAGGGFSQISGKPHRYLARLLLSGALDETFLAPSNLPLPNEVRAVPGGVLMRHRDGVWKFDESGARDLSWQFTGSFTHMDLLPDGSLAGINGQTGAGTILDASGRVAKPIGSFTVPSNASGGVSRFRAALDGSFYVAQGVFANPTNLLVHVSGTVVPLALVTQPAGVVLNSGETLSLRVAAISTSSISYQWKRNGADLPGETGPSLVISNAQMTATGSYEVVARNRSGSATSRPAAVVVLGIPEILSLSSNLTSGVADRFILAVEARGVAPLAWQWRKDGQPIPGATFPVYTNSAAALADSGRYDVQIQNSHGTTTSAAINVAIVSVPGAVIRSFAPENLNGANELAILPDGRILVGKQSGGVNAYDLQGRVDPGFATFGANNTAWQEKIAIDAKQGRVYISPSSAVRAVNYSGAAAAGFNSPTVNTRIVRVEASGTILLSDNGINPTLHRFDTNGAAIPGLAPAVIPVLDYRPTADGKIMVLGRRQRIAGGNFFFDTTLARLNADGTKDGSFTESTNIYGLNKEAAGLVLDRQERVLVFGAFETYLQHPRASIARLKADGSLDAGFVPPAINGGILDVTEQADGKLVIVGSFTQVGAVSRNLIARLNADGSHDATFDPGAGLTLSGGGQNVAFDVEILPNGNLVVAGTFREANGLPRPGLAMLTGGETGGAVNPPDRFAEWAAAAGLTGPDAAPEADPDGDGLSNRAEFIYGTLPKALGARPFRARAALAADGKSYPSVMFTRRVGATVRVEASRSIFFGELLPVVVESVTPEGANFERVTVRTTETQSGAGAQFFRMIVED